MFQKQASLNRREFSVKHNPGEWYEIFFLKYGRPGTGYFQHSIGFCFWVTRMDILKTRTEGKIKRYFCKGDDLQNFLDNECIRRWERAQKISQGGNPPETPRANGMDNQPASVFQKPRQNPSYKIAGRPGLPYNEPAGAFSFTKSYEDNSAAREAHKQKLIRQLKRL